MLKRRKLMVLCTCICCLLSTITVLAATRDSKGWNVYNSAKTVYANLGVTYVSDTFEGKANLTYTARVLGQDAGAVPKTNPARLQIVKADLSTVVNTYFWDGGPAQGTKKISDDSSYVIVKVWIDDTRGHETRVDLD